MNTNNKYVSFSNYSNYSSRLSSYSICWNLSNEREFTILAYSRDIKTAPVSDEDNIEVLREATIEAMFFGDNAIVLQEKLLQSDILVGVEHTWEYSENYEVGHVLIIKAKFVIEVIERIKRSL